MKTMPIFNWNPDKNQQLIEGRGISFEDIVFHIRQGDILDDLEHPNPDDYPEQRVMVVKVEEYAYLVPYIETAEEFFLKTIIPSRKATRKYLGE